MTRITELILKCTPKGELPRLFSEMVNLPSFNLDDADNMLRQMDEISFVRIGREHGQNRKLNGLILNIALDRISRTNPTRLFNSVNPNG